MEPENLACSSFTQLPWRTSVKGRVELTCDLRPLLLWRWSRRRAGASCSHISRVAVGEGLECGGDVSAGGFSFNEDGGCINESKESLAGVGDGIGAGEVAFSCAGGCVFSALLQCEHRAQKSNAVELPPATLLAVSS